MAEDDKQLVAPLEGDGKPSTTVGDGGGGVCTTIATSPSYQISREHSYPRLGPFKSTSGMVAMPTVVLFADRVRSKVAGRREKELSPAAMEEESEEDDIDVVSVATVPVLPYDEKKVGGIMMECARHLNLVKTPPVNSDLLMDRALCEGSYHQRSLLARLIRIIEGDHLSRLACCNMPHEPTKRRLGTDRTARLFRKALTDINWDPKLTRWVHETLLQVLDGDLLPVYLDVLQVLKAKCPVLVEQMIHSSMSMVGGEAFALLLKRPWNPVSGLQPLDMQVKFDSAPIFISLPYSSTGLGGRRWRQWQSQLSSIGKVYPIMLPDYLSDLGQGTGLREFADQMFGMSLERVHELRLQHPSRPVVLFGWSLGARIACKIAEIEPISCIVSLGLPSVGMHHKWEVTSDPFAACRVPTFFAVGSEGILTSVAYVEKLRSHMQCTTSLVVIGGGDDLLRLSAEDKEAELACQSIVDRCILEQVYSFVIDILPCSFPVDEPRPVKKRKVSNADECGSSFLAPATPSSPIMLASPTCDDKDKNFNFNNSNSLLWKAMLGLKQGTGRYSPASGSRSGTPSPVLLERRGPLDIRPVKRPLIGDLPTAGRPRSKSAADKPLRKTAQTSRLRSKSSDQPAQMHKTTTRKVAELHSRGSSETLHGVSLLPYINLVSNTNSNNSTNMSEVSPPQLLSVPHAHFKPLPITPPRNPFEDSGHKLDPKTLKHLQLK